MMPDIHFRPMDKADLPAVTRIEQDCQSHPWSLLQFLDGFNTGHEGWVVSRHFADRELVIGFAVMAPVLDESTLMNICVRPACQGEGVGRALLNFLIDEATTNGIVKVYLEVRASNKIAIGLYESLGFEQLAVRKDYYPATAGREDGLVYVRLCQKLSG